jgi:hypothetical protein
MGRQPAASKWPAAWTVRSHTLKAPRTARTACGAWDTKFRMNLQKKIQNFNFFFFVRVVRVSLFGTWAVASP